MAWFKTLHIIYEVKNNQNSSKINIINRNDHISFYFSLNLMLKWPTQTYTDFQISCKFVFLYWHSHHQAIKQKKNENPHKKTQTHTEMNITDPRKRREWKRMKTQANENEWTRMKTNENENEWNLEEVWFIHTFTEWKRRNLEAIRRSTGSAV